MIQNPLAATVTVLHGDNRLEIAQRVASARSQIDPGGLSTSIFEHSSAKVAEIAAAVSSPGFFGADRLVVCHDLVSPAATARRKRTRKADKQSEAHPMTFLKNVAPGVWLIIVEQSLSRDDERSLRTYATDIYVERVGVPRGRALIDWTCERARRHRVEIDGATATSLVEALFPATWRQEARRDDMAPDLYRLDTELAKLASASGDTAVITGELVSSLVANADSLDIWGLSNAIAARDQRRAIDQLELALDSGQAPEMILAQLAAQFETFAIVVASGGRPLSAVASATGLSEGRLRQATRPAAAYSRADIAEAMKEIRAVDFGTKQGQFAPEDALAGLVAQLSSRNAAA